MRHLLLMRMDCYLHEVDEELLLLPVMGLVLQKDCCLDEVA